MSGNVTWIREIPRYALRNPNFRNPKAKFHHVTSHPTDETIRSLSIRLLVNRFYMAENHTGLNCSCFYDFIWILIVLTGLAEITLFIEEYATNLLYDLVSLSSQQVEKKISCHKKISSSTKNIQNVSFFQSNEMKDDSNEQNQSQSNLSDEAVKRYLYLYCALCTKKNELLPGLIDAYVQVWHSSLRKTVNKSTFFSWFFVRLKKDVATCQTCHASGMPRNDESDRFDISSVAINYSIDSRWFRTIFVTLSSCPNRKW